jgi:hypothetical protein
MLDRLGVVVDDFGESRTLCQAPIAAGGKDNRPHDLRPNRHPNYDGAFVIDPSGHNIDGACHGPKA